MSEQVRFIRVRGRIIPIRSKKKKNQKYVDASMKTGLGVGIGVASTMSASKSFKQSWSLHRKSSDFRAMKKLVAPKSKKRLQFSKKMRQLKIEGLKKGGIGSKKLAIGLTVGSFFVGSAVNDLFKGTKYKEAGDEVGTIATGALGALSAGFIARKFGVKARSIESLNNALMRKGKYLSSKKTSTMRGTGLGIKKRSKKVTQLRFDI